MPEQLPKPPSQYYLIGSTIHFVKFLFILVFSIHMSIDINAQTGIDSIKQVLTTDIPDTSRVDALISLSQLLYGVNADEAEKYSQEATELAGKINDIKRKALALKSIGIANYYKGDYVNVVDDWTKSLDAFRSIEDKKGIANLLSNLGAVFEATGDTESAMQYYLESLKIAEENGDIKREATVLQNLGVLYSNMFDYETSEGYYTKALEIFRTNNISNQGIATISMNLSEVFLKSKDYTKAIEYANDSKTLFKAENHPSTPQAMLMLCEIFIAQSKYDEALSEAQKAYQLAVANNNKPTTHKALNSIGTIYNAQNNPEAIKNFKEGIAIGEKLGKNIDLQTAYIGLQKAYRIAGRYKEALVAQDSVASITNFILNVEKDSKLSNLQLQFDLEKREAKIEQLNAESELSALRLEKQRNSRNILFGLFSLFILGGFGAYTYYKNRELDRLVKERTHELSDTIENLKSTQSQLIHAEKMAALGELTAGIAHEIQNPLNFVNNFSEVSGELLVEVEEEMAEGNTEDVEEILGDLKQNLEKINHHGKRASQIVRGMLDHSRTGSTEKTPTDINQVCDEFLRLSYHGIRAKDKSFNSSFNTQFDENIGLIDVVSQDFGRVILNLINNAFYAVDKKKQSQEDNGYSPEVNLFTKDNGDTVEIRVEDNGGGMPKEVIEKVFQPFFTTKPTGEGTGLGLSLSYDIITKGHNGTIKVDSQEGAGTTFTIQLPKHQIT